jgi:hypothetical protein
VTERAWTFRDATIRSTPLRVLNATGRGLERLGLALPSLEPDSIVAAARARTNEHDLRGESFREPLERYLRAAREEAELNTLGRIVVRRMLVAALENRIRLAAWARAHPEVRDERITAPWVILGLPRTGTSLLSILLSLDPGARALTHWEAARPVPPPTLAGAAEDPRIAESAAEIAQLLELNPALAAMHPFGATVAQECVALLLFDVRTLGVETQAFVPSYGRWLERCDMTPAYEQHRLALQTLQSRWPTGRWVLKTPNHLWCLETLLSFHPDARVLWTHRDPGKVTTSLASLVNTLQGIATWRRDPRPVAEEWLHKAQHAIDSGMAFDRTREPGWCHHIRYVDLVADPIGTMKKIYARFGEEVSPLHERRMRVWLRDDAAGGHGRHAYDPADFGWTEDGLAERFAEYTRRYDVPREAGPAHGRPD